MVTVKEALLPAATRAMQASQKRLAISIAAEWGRAAGHERFADEGTAS
ncbi:hypothetical protein M1D93_05115 [Arthrobacter sp. Z1-9]